MEYSDLPQEVIDELYKEYNNVNFVLDNQVDSMTVTRGTKTKPTDDEYCWLYMFRLNIDEENNHATIRSFERVPSTCI